MNDQSYGPDSFRLVQPTWNTFESFLETCRENLVICSPWIGSDAISRLSATLGAKTTFRSLLVVSRLSDINTDSPGLLGLARALETRHVSVEMRDSAALHTKLYMADGRVALFGSANLTQSGFAENIELIARVCQNNLLEELLKYLEELRSRTDLVSSEQLGYFVESQLPCVSAPVPAPPPGRPVPIWRGHQKARFEQSTVTAGPPVQSVPTELVGTIDILDQVKAAHAILNLRQQELSAIDFDAILGKRVSLVLYPAQNEFIETMMVGGQMPFTRHRGTLTGRFSAPANRPAFDGVALTLERSPLYRFKELRHRKEIVVTPIFPFPKELSGPFMLCAIKAFHIARVEGESPESDEGD